MSDKARWIGTGQNGKVADWAGDGTCEVVSGELARSGFGQESGQGAAILVKFANGRTAWVPPDELEDV